MILKFKYFGMIAEALKKDSEVLEVDINSVSDINQYFTPQLGGISFQIAINQKLANSDTILNDNDEVALLPPFAGG